MPPVQQTEKVSFGSGRLFAVPAGGGNRIKYGELTDISVDIKIDQKEAYGEKGFPFAVADGHRSIDISAKHYVLNLAGLANDLGTAAPTASATAFAIDETAKVPSPTGPYTYSLTNATKFVVGSLDLVVFVSTNGVLAPVTYNIVASGTEVAGQSASVTAGVITFASGDAGLTFKATYQYTNTAGQMVTISNVTQNSSPSYQMVLVKQDISPLDNSMGQLIFTLNAVRPGGIKAEYKEGDFTVYDRSFKAFADPTGNVGTLQFVNV